MGVSSLKIPPGPPFSKGGIPSAESSIRERLAGERGQRFWRSLDELADTEEFRQFLLAEFPRQAQSVFDAVEPPSTNGHLPHVTLIVGVNGTGKTTTVGKLANLLKSEGNQPLICAADTFRAAAVEQLEIWAKRANVDIIRAKEGSDPAAVVFDAIQSGKARNRNPILIDTAGRLHNRVNLMNELEKIRRVAARAADGAPHEVLLVLDATVGQNGVQQAREFTNVAGVTGIVLTKLDGTAKGGVAVAIATDLKLPIRYVGVGEGIDDLVPFSADEYVDGLFEEKW